MEQGRPASAPSSSWALLGRRRSAPTIEVERSSGATRPAFAWALLLTLAVAGLTLRGLARRAAPIAAASVDGALSAVSAPIAARLERTPKWGRERLLRGETKFTLTDSRRSATVNEEAELADDGRLERAEVRVLWSGETQASDRGSPTLLLLDARRGTVFVAWGDGRSETRRVSTDLPWAYVPLAIGGVSASTPVAVSVAQRAAEAGHAVRLLDATGHDTTVMSDQIAGSQGAEGWVLLGDDVAIFALEDGGHSELLRVHVAALGVDLRPGG